MSKHRRKGRKANYRGASPEQVAKALHAHRPARDRDPEPAAAEQPR